LRSLHPHALHAASEKDGSHPDKGDEGILVWNGMVAHTRRSRSRAKGSGLAPGAANEPHKRRSGNQRSVV
jgi:hypothetical protein